MFKSLEEMREQLRRGIATRCSKVVDSREDSSSGSETIAGQMSLVGDPVADFENADTRLYLDEEEEEKEKGPWSGTLPAVVKHVEEKYGPIKGRHVDIIVVDDIIVDKEDIRARGKNSGKS